MVQEAIRQQEVQPTEQIGLQFELHHESPTSCSVTITIPSIIVDTTYHEALNAQKTATRSHGFQQGNIPLEYIKRNFNAHLIDHLKEFLLKFFVKSFLYRSILHHKILVGGVPRLNNIFVEPGKDATFNFELSLFPALEVHEWKYLPFKSPKRKNYRDLDRQVDTFIKDEKEALKNYTNDAIAVGDWINYSLALVNAQGEQLVPGHQQHFWLKIGDEEADKEFNEVFVGKKPGEAFVSNHPCLQDYFSGQLDTNYQFLVTIVNVVPLAYFCFELFKKHFRIKTNKEMHLRLIEVYSQRNDLSQRCDIVDEIFKLLLTKNKFVVPNYLILRQQQLVMDSIQSNPDYYVYRMQRDFKESVRNLAEKQAEQALLIDQMAFDENIQITDADIICYLNMTKRPRMKSFLHFALPVTKIDGQEHPVLTEELMAVCAREKMLNYIIYHLTRA